MRATTFIHCADLHLGHAPKGGEERFLDFGRAFAQVVDVSLEKRAPLVIAGDLFHQRAIDPSTLALAAAELARLKSAGVPVIAIEGNHDKALYVQKLSWMQYLQHEGLLYLLGPLYDESGTPRLAPHDGVRGSTLILDGIRFVGLGYLGGSTKERLEILSTQLGPFDGFSVALLHAALNRLLTKDMAGITSASLDAFANVDYFALGHIHNMYQEGNAYNPGAPECVRLEEASKPKGFFVVEDSAPRFMESKRREVFAWEVDVTGLSAVAAEQLVCKSAQGKTPRSIAAITLKGEIAEWPMDLKRVERALCAQGFLYAELEDLTNSKREGARELGKDELETMVLEELAGEAGLAASGEVLRALKEQLLRGEAAGDILAWLEEVMEGAHEN